MSLVDALRIAIAIAHLVVLLVGFVVILRLSRRTEEALRETKRHLDEIERINNATLRLSQRS